jgi:hypothetical protein
MRLSTSDRAIWNVREQRGRMSGLKRLSVPTVDAPERPGTTRSTR